MIYQSDNDKLKNVLFIFQNYSIKTSAGTQMFCTPSITSFGKWVLKGGDFKDPIVVGQLDGEKRNGGESGEVEVKEGEGGVEDKCDLIPRINIDLIFE